MKSKMIIYTISKKKLSKAYIKIKIRAILKRKIKKHKAKKYGL